MENLDYHYDLFKRTIENIEAAAAIKTPEEIEELKAEAYLELQDRIADEMGLIDEYEDEEELVGAYSDSADFANFEAGNEFGAAVLELAAEEYEDPADAIVDIAEYTGLDVEDVVGLIEGHYVPTEELAHAISEVFAITSSDDTYYAGLMALAEDARAEEGYEEVEVDEDEDEDTEVEEAVEEASYRIAELENQVAEFAAQREVSDALQQIENMAAEGVSDHWLPPVAKEHLLGSFSTDSDRIAAFSQVCGANGVDPAQQLYAMQFALDLFQKCGPFARFSSVLDGEAIAPKTAKEADLEKQARLNFQLMKERK